jgi:K+ transporter
LEDYPFMHVVFKGVAVVGVCLMIAGTYLPTLLVNLTFIVIVVANSYAILTLDGVLTPAQSVLGAVQGKPIPISIPIFLYYIAIEHAPAPVPHSQTNA